MEPVAVGGFDDQILGVLHELGIPQDRLAEVAHVAGEGDLSRLAPLPEPDLDGGGAQQVPHIRHAQGDAVVHLEHPAVVAGAQQADGADGVVQIVEGLLMGRAAALPLAVFVLRLAHLDVGAVAQHDVAEGAGGGGGVDGAAVALLVQQRELARVVDVGVGQQHKVQLRSPDRQGLVFKEILPLLHAAVHQALFIAHLDERAAAGDLMGRAEKCDFHESCPPSPQNSTLKTQKD